MFSIVGNVFAEKGFYINLSTSIERREHIENLCLKHDIQNLERFEALTDEMIQFSCTKSHMEIFKESLNNDYDIIFIAEDDIDINDICYYPLKNENIFFNDVIKNIKKDLDTVKWDVVLFGCNPKSTIIPVTENLGIIDNSTGAWAYLIKKNAYKFIIDNLNYKKDYLAIDDFLPRLNDHGFTTLTTIPLTINHAVGFVSTLQPRGPVDYSRWIEGNYHKFLFDNYRENFNEPKIEKSVTILITGHFVDNYLFYLKYLFHSLPDSLKHCKFLIHYDENSKIDVGFEILKLNAYFRDCIGDVNVSLNIGFGGLINSLNTSLNKIRTPYFILLEHDWVFLKKDNIDFLSLVNAFDNHDFINAVWFGKDDNSMRGFEISVDADGITTPFKREDRVDEVDLITTCRWSNNPGMFRTSKMKDWFENIIKNEHIGKIHQGQHNVEETIIPVYRRIISENKWDDIKDDWGTFLYGRINEGPYVGHTDASKRYQTTLRTTAEDNADKYIKNNPLPEYD